MHNPTAEEIMGAALDVGIHGDQLEELLAEFGIADWVKDGNRCYPPNYVHALGRCRASPAVVQRLRDELSSVPRVNPEDYDILFNLEGSGVLPEPTWDVVKWLRIPESAGWLPGYGWTACVVADPYPIYHIPASRGLLSLGDQDFNHLRRNATVLREGGKGIDRSMLENNLATQAAMSQRRADEDLDFAEYYRGLFRKDAEDKGI